MAHRSRSKTADSAESKKTKGTPRRLTEKIAIMRRKEHEQSEAFEQAMRSIFEMQRARIHGGGGSMPSLQNIDSTPPPPTIDMQMVYKDFNEMTNRGSNSYSSHKERPRSGGPSGRRGVVARSGSSDTDPYPMMGIGPPEHGPYWNAGPDWIDGDLSRHKSDSDLQQSLMLQQQQQSPHHAPLLLGSPQQQAKNHKLTPPGDLSLYKPRTRPNSMTAHALLSPDQYVTSPDAAQGSPSLGMSSGGTASSLPDLTNIDFSSGLDVPLESDDDQQLSPQHVNSAQPPPLSSQFHSPTSLSKGPGPSKLIYTSYQAPPSPVAQRRIMFQSSFPFNNHSHHQQQQQAQQPFHSSASATGLQHQHSPNSGMGMRQPVSPGYGSGLYAQNSLGGIQKSPTMPDFRTLNNYSQHAAAPISQFKPILPSFADPGTQLPPYRPPPGSLPSFISSPPQQGTNVHSPLGGMNNKMNVPPPMTIIIQPPPSSAAAGLNTMGANNGTAASPASQQQVNGHQLPAHSNPGTSTQAAHSLKQGGGSHHHHHHQQPPQQQTPQTQGAASTMSGNFHIQQTHHAGPQTPPQGAQMSSPGAQPVYDQSISSPPSVHHPSTPPVSSNLLPSLSFNQSKMPFTASLPNTPTITVGPGLPVLPSYMEAKQQQALQQKLAAINVGRDEPLFRSHSEENLQKAQKEPSGMIQHNPFMGTLANANSVPCVYVESANTDNTNEMNERSESPTTVDSPSTSASYASSPPSVRPFWMDLPPNMQDFVFNEWPPLGAPGNAGAAAVGGASGSGQAKPSSPPAHHRSLTDLNTIPEVGELSSPNRSKNLLHQLSLPSVAMMDLTVDENYYNKNPQSPSDFFLPPDADFEMEDAVMNTLLSNAVPDLDTFDVNVLTNEANMLASEVIMSSSPDSFLHGKTSFN